MKKRGIVIANTGSPSAPTPEAVRTYLREFLTDPRIRPMNPMLWGFILNAFILPRRSKASAEKYARIWTPEGSPLDASMRSLARRLSEAFGEEAEVRYAMSYGTPSLMSAFHELRRAGCTELIILPLYPQSALSTTEVIRDRSQSALEEMRWNPPIRFIDRYSESGTYIDAITDSIREAGFRKEDGLLLVFHSIPMRDIDDGDEYAEQVHATAEAIADRLGIGADEWAVGFQCRFDKSRAWLGPTTLEAVEALKKGSGRIFIAAPNFSIDCLETLYDIEKVLKGRLLAIDGIDEVRYVRCLNDSPTHVALLRELVDARTDEGLQFTEHENRSDVVRTPDLNHPWSG